MKKIELHKSLGFLFHNINLNMRKKFENDIKVYGLSSAHQFGVLSLLFQKSMSQKEISDATLADEPSTTRMLNRMIKKKIIAKKQSQDDKRKQIVYITEEGKELLSKIFPITAKHNKAVENLIDEEELEVLFKILNKINQKI